MRAGSAFRRCTKDGCRARVAARARVCPKCGGDSISWAFVVDVALPGSKRKQHKGGGFATKAAAVITSAYARLRMLVMPNCMVKPTEAIARMAAAVCEDASTITGPTALGTTWNAVMRSQPGGGAW